MLFMHVACPYRQRHICFYTYVHVRRQVWLPNWRWLHLLFSCGFVFNCVHFTKVFTFSNSKQINVVADTVPWRKRQTVRQTGSADELIGENTTCRLKINGQIKVHFLFALQLNIFIKKHQWNDNSESLVVWGFAQDAERTLMTTHWHYNSQIQKCV